MIADWPVTCQTIRIGPGHSRTYRSIRDKDWLGCGGKRGDQSKAWHKLLMFIVHITRSPHVRFPGFLLLFSFSVLNELDQIQPHSWSILIQPSLEICDKKNVSLERHAAARVIRLETKGFPSTGLVVRTSTVHAIICGSFKTASTFLSFLQWKITCTKLFDKALPHRSKPGPQRWS